MNSSTICKRVRRARKEAAYTREELAAEVGCSIASVQAWEQGRREPRALFVRKLAEVTGKPVGWFFEEEAA